MGAGGQAGDGVPAPDLSTRGSGVLFVIPATVRLGRSQSRPNSVASSAPAACNPRPQLPSGPGRSQCMSPFGPRCALGGVLCAQVRRVCLEHGNDAAGSPCPTPGQSRTCDPSALSSVMAKSPPEGPPGGGGGPPSPPPTLVLASARGHGAAAVTDSGPPRRGHSTWVPSPASAPRAPFRGLCGDPRGGRGRDVRTPAPADSVLRTPGSQRTPSLCRPGPIKRQGLLLRLPRDR